MRESNVPPELRSTFKEFDKQIERRIALSKRSDVPEDVKRLALSAYGRMRTDAYERLDGYKRGYFDLAFVQRQVADYTKTLREL